MYTDWRNTARAQLQIAIWLTACRLATRKHPDIRVWSRATIAQLEHSAGWGNYLRSADVTRSLDKLAREFMEGRGVKNPFSMLASSEGVSK